MNAAELHTHFQALTGQKLTLSYARMQTWAAYVARGLTGEDLELVVRWTRAQIARNEGGFSPLSLQFRAMVEDLDKFEDRLNVARTSKFARRPASPVAAAPATAAGSKISAEDEERLRAQGKEAMEKLRHQLRGPTQP